MLKWIFIVFTITIATYAQYNEHVTTVIFKLVLFTID